MKKITILPEHLKRIQSRLNPRVKAKEDFQYMMFQIKREFCNIDTLIIAILVLLTVLLTNLIMVFNGRI